MIFKQSDFFLHCRMFVSSSLERIPPHPAPIGKSASFTQVNNINGNSSGEDSGRSDIHPTASSSTTSSDTPSIASAAAENTTTPPTTHSPTLTTTSKNNVADAASFIPTPATRSACHIIPLTEVR